MSLATKFDDILARSEELRDLLSSGVTGTEFVRASRELAELDQVVGLITALRETEQNLS